MTELVIIVCVAGVLYYIHKVGLPAVVAEIRQFRLDVTTAIARHTNTTTGDKAAKVSSSAGPDKVG